MAARRTADGPPSSTGAARRRARTRGALLRAGRQLLAEGRETASIADITSLAGVGFGSFFNHFPGGKEELFSETVFEVVDAYSAWLATANDGVSDPAEVFARGYRLTGRLAADSPELLEPVLARGTTVLVDDRDLRRAALRDLRSGTASGRFTLSDPETALALVGGSLLGLVRLLTLTRRDDAEELVDEAAAAALRLLGVAADEAARLVALPLPEIPPLDV